MDNCREDETTDKSDGSEQVYESLEAIHVFALAHILKQPIIGVLKDLVHPLLSFLLSFFRILCLLRELKCHFHFCQKP